MKYFSSDSCGTRQLAACNSPLHVIEYCRNCRHVAYGGSDPNPRPRGSEANHVGRLPVQPNSNHLSSLWNLLSTSNSLKTNTAPSTCLPTFPMVQLTSIFATAILATAGTTTLAHPGGHHERSLAEIEAQKQFHANAHRSLAACANHPHFRDLQERSAARRLDAIQSIHEQRRRLSLADIVNRKHKTALSCVTPHNYDKVALFGSTPKCVLSPDVTQGPYYVRGEYIRNDIREDQQGIDLYALLQFIDINTCEPVNNYFVDLWGANSTGVYSGAVASGNGDSNDLTNANTTYLRGIAPTDKDSIVQFITKYPGHYTSRAHHLHVVVSHGGKVLQNNTYSGTGISSVGQVYFDEDLSREVLKTAPYNTNKQELTTNKDDIILLNTPDTGFDPVLEYALLGNSVEDGVFSWISIGINASVSRNVKPAMFWTSEGGQANQNFTFDDMGINFPVPSPATKL